MLNKKQQEQKKLVLSQVAKVATSPKLMGLRNALSELVDGLDLLTYESCLDDLLYLGNQSSLLKRAWRGSQARRTGTSPSRYRSPKKAITEVVTITGRAVVEHMRNGNVESAMALNALVSGLSKYGYDELIDWLLDMGYGSAGTKVASDARHKTLGVASSEKKSNVQRNLEEVGQTLFQAHKELENASELVDYVLNDFPIMPPEPDWHDVLDLDQDEYLNEFPDEDTNHVLLTLTESKNWHEGDGGDVCVAWWDGEKFHIPYPLKHVKDEHVVAWAPFVMPAPFGGKKKEVKK